jgi:hypothetical protein
MNPRKTLSVAGEYFGVLEYLCTSQEGVSYRLMAEALRMKMADQPDNPRQAIQLLASHGLLEPSPEADDIWEVPPMFMDLVLKLSNRQRLIAPGMLRGLLEDLKRETLLLSRAISHQEFLMVSDCCKRTIDLVQQAQKFSEEHHAAVIVAVMGMKTREDKRPLKERFLHIKDLYERHLKNMQELVDVDGLLDATLGDILNVTRDSALAASYGLYHSSPVSRLRAHVLQLKRAAANHFHESLKEVVPLYNKLRRDHELSAAASRLLDVYARNGSNAWNIQEEMPIAYCKEEMLFTGMTVERHVGRIAEYKDDSDIPLVAPENSEVVEMVDLLYIDDIIASLEPQLPVPDTLAWLFANFGAYGETQVLCAYQLLEMQPAFVTNRSDAEAQLVFNNVRYTYYPMRLEHGLPKAA